MQTIDEFNAAWWSYSREVIVVTVLAGLVLFLGLAAVVPFGPRIRANFGEVLGGMIPGLVMLPSFLVLFGGLWLVERRGNRRVSLRCPHCGKPLTRDRHWVIVTRKCGQCKQRVLAEPD